jgi:cyclophilin family peptidyl-prolyl cis-trans isomerase
MQKLPKNPSKELVFITHAPTTHLDGRYTIFAKVVEGYDIIHQIQVGDRINSIEID